MVMKYHIENRILHIIYCKKDRNSKEFINICEVSKIYEGTDTHLFVGFNFPMDIVPLKNQLYRYKNDVDYIIVYKKGDRQTKMHELYHAKFYIDNEYKKSVYKLWNSITKSSKENIINMLLRMKYKNNKDILIDEFQAYYNTEKPNFFGKITYL